VGWGYQLFFFFFLPVSADESVEVVAESDVAVVSGVVAVVLVEASGVEAGGVEVDGSVVGAVVLVDGVVCGVVGAGVVWANATPETPTIRAPASVRYFIRYSPVLNGPKRKRTEKPKGSALGCRYIQGIERLTGD
jgi:hypothetical protein